MDSAQFEFRSPQSGYAPYSIPTLHSIDPNHRMMNNELGGDVVLDNQFADQLEYALEMRSADADAEFNLQPSIEGEDGYVADHEGSWGFQTMLPSPVDSTGEASFGDAALDHESPAPSGPIDDGFHELVGWTGYDDAQGMATEAVSGNADPALAINNAHDNRNEHVSVGHPELDEAIAEFNRANPPSRLYRDAAVQTQDSAVNSRMVGGLATPRQPLFTRRFLYINKPRHLEALRLYNNMHGLSSVQGQGQDTQAATNIEVEVTINMY